MKFDIDLRPFETLHAISLLKKYLDLMETQLEEAQRLERNALDARRPTSCEEEDLHEFSSMQNYLEDVYDHELRPTMRYSFVVFMHIVFETRIRSFCSMVQRERNLPLAISDLRGSAIDQAHTYLTRVAGLPLENSGEWQYLRTLQKIRDCIVHAHGFVVESRDNKFLEKLADGNVDITINDYGRLSLTKAFCEKAMAQLEVMFHHLFKCAGWRV